MQPNLHCLSAKASILCLQLYLRFCIILVNFDFSYIPFTYLWMFWMNFFMAHTKKFGSLLSSFGQSDLTNFQVSISHLCWVCRHQKFSRVSFENIFRQKEFPRATCFWIMFGRIKKVKNIDQLDFDFALKALFTLKMFLKCPKLFLYYTEFTGDNRIQVQASKIRMFLGEIYCGASLKSFSGRNNSLKPLVFTFCDSLP